MKSVFGNRKLVISVFVILILASTALALGPLVFSLVMGRGVKTEPINLDRVKAASTELDGQWNVVKGSPYNFTSAGFTIDEILPADKRTTSGSTKEVTGQATISDSDVEAATITVDMTTLTTDKKVRDQNMKTKLFEVAKYPESTFELTERADFLACLTTLHQPPFRSLAISPSMARLRKSRLIFRSCAMVTPSSSAAIFRSIAWTSA